MLSWWGRILYWTTWGLVRCLAALLFRLRVEGAANVPRRGGILVASNHVSHLDPPLLGVSFRRPVFHMAKRELFKIWPLMAYMRTIRTIMVDRGRGRQSLEDAIRYLDAGAAVIIFPEGTRSKSGRLMPGRSGAVYIAIQADSPLLPVAIIGSQHAMTKGSKVIKPVPVTVRIGEPYRIAYGGDRTQIPRDVAVRETARLMEKIEALLPAEMRPGTEDKAAWYGQAAEPAPS
jgi:1-acyl-sn-glycerol-3-phosphate acyltransferase